MPTAVVHPLNGVRPLDELSRDELIKLVEAGNEGGIRIDFSGKSNARKLSRRVRPRIARTIKKYSIGSEQDQARNLLVEGDNLQAMATLFRERGQVDLILTDPPYNTGHDWRYNDRWEDDPNDPGLGEWVNADDGDRHTKWMRFMWPRLRMMKEMLKPAGVLAICIDHRELFRGRFVEGPRRRQHNSTTRRSRQDDPAIPLAEPNPALSGRSQPFPASNRISIGETESVPATNRPSRVRSIHHLVCGPCAVGSRAAITARPTASTRMPLNPCSRAKSRS